MSLTASDLGQIENLVRNVVTGVIDVKIEPRLTRIDGELTAQGNDIKDIYGILSKVDSRLDRVDHRLDRVDSRLSRVDHRLKRVDSRLDLIEGHLGLVVGTSSGT